MKPRSHSSNAPRILAAAALISLAFTGGALGQSSSPVLYFTVDGQTQWTNGSNYYYHDETPFHLGSGGASSASGHAWTVTGGFGAASASLNFNGAVSFGQYHVSCPYGCTDTWEVNGVTIKVYVRGPAGTPYVLRYSKSASGNAVTSTSMKTMGFWSDLISKDTGTGIGPVSDSKSVPQTTVAGTTVGPSVPCGNTTCSFATTIPFGGNGFRSNSSSNNGYGWDFPGGASAQENYSLAIDGYINRPGQQPPVARIIAPTTAALNSPVTLDGSTSSDPDGNIVEYRWDIQKSGGGTDVLFGSVVQYTWTTPNTYNVMLTVTDNDGQRGVANATVIASTNACTYQILPPQEIFSWPGGTGTISVTPSDSSCTWDVRSNASWVTVNSPSTGTGTGAGSVAYAVAENANNTPRTATIAIANQFFQVIQRQYDCAFSISPLGAAFGTAGGSGTVAITQVAPNVNRSQCAWSVSGIPSWVTPNSSTSGQGNGSFNYSVSQNTSMARRSAELTIARQSFALRQDGVTFGPTIDVTPRSLDFGRKASRGGSFGNCVSSAQPRDMRLVIKNVGQAGSTLTGAVSSPADPFSITSGAGSFSLSAGQSVLVVVRFDPAADANYVGEIHITSNDPILPDVVVPLSGEGNRYEKLSPLKGRFGQFPYCDTSGDNIEIDPAWVAANICTVNSGIPLITDSGLASGNVRVHCAATANFTQAFAEIRNQGLTSSVQTFPGLWVPRYVGGAAHIPNNLSNHSWGSAIDLNYVYGSKNFPCYETNPSRPVSSGCGVPSIENINLWNLVFKDRGFFWGVDYSTPTRSDPMHFEAIP